MFVPVNATRIVRVCLRTGSCGSKVPPTSASLSVTAANGKIRLPVNTCWVVVRAPVMTGGSFQDTEVTVVLALVAFELGGASSTQTTTRVNWLVPPERN